MDFLFGLFTASRSYFDPTMPSASVFYSVFVMRLYKLFESRKKYSNNVFGFVVVDALLSEAAMLVFSSFHTAKTYKQNHKIFDFFFDFEKGIKMKDDSFFYITNSRYENRLERDEYFFSSKIFKKMFFGYAHTLVEVLISEGEIPQGGKQHLLLLLHHFFLNESFFFFLLKKVEE
jgi:hypothetical protein